MVYFIRKLFCKHWWKAMGVVRSAYFVKNSGTSINWEIHECKKCGAVKMNQY